MCSIKKKEILKIGIIRDISSKLIPALTRVVEYPGSGYVSAIRKFA